MVNVAANCNSRFFLNLLNLGLQYLPLAANASKHFFACIKQSNSPTLRLYGKLELSSFNLQSVCLIKIHRRHVMSYFLLRNSVQVIIFSKCRSLEAPVFYNATSRCLLSLCDIRNRWYTGLLRDFLRALPNSNT